MTALKEMLSGGDMRSDGLATEVSKLVLTNSNLIADLVSLLEDKDDLIRGRSADVFEKVVRKENHYILDYYDLLKKIALTDNVPMVKFHLAMVFGYISDVKEKLEETIKILSALVEDDSVFVKCWAITSLCIIGKENKDYRLDILKKIKSQKDYDSKAVKNKVQKAINVLEFNIKIPKNWIKKERKRN